MAKEKDSASMIEIMRGGMSTNFWAELVSITRENIKMLETEIITKINIQTGAELTDEEVDRKRDKREAMEDLINLPQEIIDSSMKEDTEEESDDPYPQNKADIARMDSA